MKHSSKAPTQSVMDLLRRNPSAEGLIPTAEKFLALQKDVAALLPAGMPDTCKVCQFDAGELHLAVPSPTLASKLRQTLPRLRSGLEARGWKVNAIQLRVQPSNSLFKSMTYVAPAKQAQIPEAALPHLADLAESMDDSPLRNAVRDLLRHQRLPKR